MNSTLTRFRVQTAVPLDPLKVWHAIPSESNIKSVDDLSKNIAQSLGLTEVDGEIYLELDGFALLPSSPVGVVRDGDVVTVHCRPRMGKRKATEGVDQPKKKQKAQSPVPTTSVHHEPPATSQHRPKPPVSSQPGPSRQITASKSPVARRSSTESSSSDVDTTSSDSDSSSDDDSESSSDSESESTGSDSSSDSDSESDTGPISQPISRQPLSTVRQPSLLQAAISPVRRTPSQPPVPPGQGKQSTRSRNARRRTLRKHQAAGTVLSPSSTPTPAPVTTTPTPVPIIESMITTQVKASTPIAPAKNANKNKRRGFDKDMADAVATRITFGTPTSVPSIVDPPSRVDSPAVPPGQTKSRYTHYHVVPPSQRTDLPPNVVVTSVDVEAVDGLEGVGQWFDGENREPDEEMVVENEMSQPAPNDSSKVDWEVVDSEWEKSWDSFPVVAEAVWSILRAGNLLAFKNLTIDPVTCTPCTKIHVARVVSGPSSDSGEVECFFIERPGARAVGFGFGGKFGPVDEMDDSIVDEEVGETRNVSFPEVEGWKLVG